VALLPGLWLVLFNLAILPPPAAAAADFLDQAFYLFGHHRAIWARRRRRAWCMGVPFELVSSWPPDFYWTLGDVHELA
jgi:hypothetical protein